MGPFDDLPEATGGARVAAGAFDDLPDAKKPAATEAEPTTTLGRTLRYVDNLVRQAANGATFGFADEMAAGADTALAPLTGSTKTYGERVGDERARDRTFQAENPIAATGSDVVGAIASPVLRPLGLAAKAIPKIIEALPGGASLVGRTVADGAGTLVGRSATTGGLAAGVGGFGSGEGDFESRLGSAAGNAPLGFAIGAGAPVVTAGAQAVGRGLGAVGDVAKTLTGTYDARQRAIERVAQKIADSGKTADEIAAALDAAGGKPLALADVGGEQTQRLARTVSDIPGPGSSRMKDFLTERDLGVGDNPLARTGGAVERVGGDLEKTFGNSLFHATDDALVKQQERVATPLYKEFEKLDPVPIGTFSDFVTAPAFVSAMKKADIMAKNEGVEGVQRYFKVDKLTGDLHLAEIELPPRIVDYIKRGFDDTIENSIRKGDLNNVRIITGLKNKFLDVADDALPGYAVARDAWAGPESARDALRLGRKAVTGDPGASLRAFSDMSSGNQEMFRIGFKKALVDTVKNTRDGADELKRIVGTPAMRERMAGVLSPSEFDDIIGRFGQESTMYGTKQAVLGGSRTAPSLMDQGENAAANFGASVVTGGPRSALVHLAARKIAAAGGMTKSVADEASKILTETNPQQLAPLLGELRATGPLSLETRNLLLRNGMTRSQAIAAAIAEQQAQR